MCYCRYIPSRHLTWTTLSTIHPSLLFNPTLASILSHLLSPGTLDGHLSALLWVAMLVSLAIVIILPQPHGVRVLIASTILRLIFSVGLEPTLFLLGAFNVRLLWETCVFDYIVVRH